MDAVGVQPMDAVGGPVARHLCGASRARGASDREPARSEGAPVRKAANRQTMINDDDEPQRTNTHDDRPQRTEANNERQTTTNGNKQQTAANDKQRTTAADDKQSNEGN